MKRPIVTWMALGGAAVGFALAAMFVFSYSFRRGEVYAEGSSYRSTTDGLRALALLLESRGHAVTRLVDTWKLPEHRGVLVSVASHHAPAAASS